MITRLRTLRVGDLILTVLIPLVGGWIVSLGYALLMTRLQYDQIAGSQAYNPGAAMQGPFIDKLIELRLVPLTPARLFQHEQIAAQANARLGQLLGQGPGLLLPQIAVLIGLLVWLIIRYAKRTRQPDAAYTFAAISGLLVALIDCGIALFVLQVPILLTGALFAMIVGAALFGAWSGADVVPSP